MKSIKTDLDPRIKSNYHYKMPDYFWFLGWRDSIYSHLHTQMRDLLIKKESNYEK
jgi:hypothetical protein